MTEAEESLKNSKRGRLVEKVYCRIYEVEGMRENFECGKRRKRS